MLFSCSSPLGQPCSRASPLQVAVWIHLLIRCRGSSAPAPGAPPSHLLLSPWCHRAVSPTLFFFFLTPHCHAAFCPFSNMLSQRCCHCGRGARPCPAVGSAGGAQGSPGLSPQAPTLLPTPGQGHPEQPAFPFSILFHYWQHQILLLKPPATHHHRFTTIRETISNVEELLLESFFELILSKY